MKFRWRAKRKRLHDTAYMGHARERRYASFRHFGLFRVYVAFFCLSCTEPGPRDLAVAEPRTCPSKGQDPAGDLEMPEAEAAPVSITRTRDANRSIFCSRSLNLLWMTQGVNQSVDVRVDVCHPLGNNVELLLH